MGLFVDMHEQTEMNLETFGSILSNKLSDQIPKDKFFIVLNLTR